MPDFIKHGEQHIAAMIRAAHAAGRTEVVVSGCYEIGETVLLPSHTTLILSDCHLRMAETLDRKDRNYGSLYWH